MPCAILSVYSAKQAKDCMQPLTVAKLQARIIEHDENCMYEVLEDCSWDFEKVRSPHSGRAFRHETAAINLHDTVCAVLYRACGHTACGASVSTSSADLRGVLNAEGSTPLDPSTQPL